MMEVPHYVPEGYLIPQVARAPETGVGKAFLQAIRIRMAEIQAEIDTRPVLSDDLSEDLRTKLGELKGLRWLVRLHEDARQFIEQEDTQQDERDER